MSRITYCVGINRPYDDCYISTHINFIKLLPYKVDIYLIYFDDLPLPVIDEPNVYCLKVKNWGGGVGLLDQALEQIPNLAEYVLFFEADVHIKNPDCFDKMKFILQSRTDLVYVGHILSEYHWVEQIDCVNEIPIYVKHAPNMQESLMCGDCCYWSDGGIYFFDSIRLLNAKEKLKVLPGFVTKNNDGTITDNPLCVNSTINFRDQGQRVLYHEVGFPSRLKYHGFNFAAVVGMETVLRKSGII